LKDVFAGETGTLGEIVLHAKQKMMQPATEAPGGDQRQLLDAVAKVISPMPDQLEDERHEHLSLFNLLGDPLLRLPRSQSVRVQAPRYLLAGERAKVQLECDVGGMCAIDLVCRRDRLRQSAPERPHYDGRDRVLREYRDVYLMANDPAWYVQSIECQPGTTELEFEVPADAHGQCHVRAFVSGVQQAALGSADVFVRRGHLGSQ
jgi:hypothetical protein